MAWEFGRMCRWVSSLVLVLVMVPGTLHAAEQSGHVSEPSGTESPKTTATTTSGGNSVSVEVALSAGGVMAWETPEESGNAFGASASIVWSDFRAGLVYGAALPDSRFQGMYHNLWAEFTWFALGSLGASHVRPYVSAGAGVALKDAPPEVRLGDPETIRWNDETTFLGTLALGARYGLTQGLFVAVDVRTYNLAFGGYTLTAGYTF